MEKYEKRTAALAYYLKILNDEGVLKFGTTSSPDELFEALAQDLKKISEVPL